MIFMKLHGCLTREDRFLLALLFPRDDDEIFRDTRRQAWESIDWESVLKKAEEESVAAMAFHAVCKRRLENKIPPETLEGFRRAYYANLKRSLFLLGHFKRLFTRLREAGIPFLVIKGIALAEQVYPVVALRGMSDVDLLVKKDHILSVDRLLSSLGYSPVDSVPAEALGNPVGYLCSLEYQVKDVAAPPLHVHWHLVNTSTPAVAYAGNIRLDSVWEQAVPATVAEADTLVLCPEHLIIYLCEHALRVGHSFDRLILVCDIHQALVAYAGRLDWDALVREAEAFGLSRFVFLSLTIVRAYTGIAIPPEVIESLRPRRFSIYERIFLGLQLSNRRIRGSSYLVHLAESRGPINKGRLIFRTFFPPLNILRQRHHGPMPSLAVFFYLWRIREVFGPFAGLRRSSVKRR